MKEPDALAPAEVVSRVDELLELSYRSGDLGNLDRPLDEAVYILLSMQTRHPVYQAVYRRLRERYPAWIDVSDADPDDLLTILRPAGFQNQRLERLQGLLSAVARENELRGIGPAAGGDLTLDYLASESDRKALAHLEGLPGLGPKAARCILAYAFDRASFAVDTHVRRVLERLQLVKESKGKPDHREAEALVRPTIRKRLHINLVHHGRAVCRSSRPKCDECVLVSFCEMGKQAVRETIDDKPTVLELFAGAGGLGLGFRTAGYRVRAAVEHDRDPAQTYRLNHPGVPVLETDVRRLAAADIRSLAGDRGIDVLIAGPPCQGYSAAGRRDPSDPINLLYRQVARVARVLSPQLVLIENVPGIRRVNGVGFADRIRRSLHRAGYRVGDPYLVTAIEFGVPQHRQRLIYLARRSDLGEAPGPPRPTHAAPSAGADSPTPGLAETPTLEAVLSDLPELGAGVELEFAESSTRTIYNASTMRHSPAVIAKISRIEPGGGPISYRRLERTAARTLVAGHRALPVHPWLDRTISVREAARIQGFPDAYVFAGTRSAQPSQVANAVPPPLARALADQLLDHLEPRSKSQQNH